MQKIKIWCRMFNDWCLSSTAPRTILPRMPDIVDLQAESLRLSGQRPFIDTTVPLTYRIDMQEPPSREWRTIATGVPDNQYHVTGLRPNKDYLFRVTPSTPTYTMEPLPYVTLTSMPGNEIHDSIPRENPSISYGIIFTQLHLLKFLPCFEFTQTQQYLLSSQFHK